jgi:drug/metabolite transporter (DMT)-like permease
MHCYLSDAQREKYMKRNFGKVTLAASAFVFAGLFSFTWSEQSGGSLSIEKAEARVGRPLTPMSVAGVARRNNRRAGYGAYGAAAAVGTAAAIGAGAAYHAGDRYYGGPVRAASAAYNNYPTETVPHYAVRAYYAGGPWYGYSGWDEYASRNGIGCTPGTMVKLADGHMYVCQ